MEKQRESISSYSGKLKIEKRQYSYEIYITDENKVGLQISIENSGLVWVNSFDIVQLIEENACWSIFVSNDEIFEYLWSIFSNNNSNNFALIHENEIIKLVLWLEVGNKKKEFFLQLMFSSRNLEKTIDKLLNSNCDCEKKIEILNINNINLNNQIINLQKLNENLKKSEQIEKNKNIFQIQEINKLKKTNSDYYNEIQQLNKKVKDLEVLKDELLYNLQLQSNNVTKFQNILSFCMKENTINIKKINEREFTFVSEKNKFGIFAVDQTFSSDICTLEIEFLKSPAKSGLAFGVIASDAAKISGNWGKSVYITNDGSYFQFTNIPQKHEFCLNMYEKCHMVLNFKNGELSFYNLNQKFKVEFNVLKNRYFRIWFCSLNAAKAFVKFL